MSGKKMPLLALFYGEKTYVIKELEPILEDLKRDQELRREIIEQQKAFLLIDKRVNGLVKRGFLEIAYKPDPSEDIDLAVRRFARILRKEFPEDWKQVKVEWRK